MASIMKKVFRSGSGKKNGSKKADSATSSSNSIPRSPPSPDFSGLTNEEVTILKDVLKRQEQFETEEVERREKLCESLQMFEAEVKKSAGQKSKLKHVDLRLCKLCFKTKFADGIGKACYDCHKRVCNRCGSFSRPKANGKKHKNYKGNWRCNMCQMKRDVCAMTGGWYHGDDKQPIASTETIKKKLSVSELDSSENDTGYLYSTGTDLTQDDCLDKSDHATSHSAPQGSSPKSRRGSTRRSSRTRRQLAAELEKFNDDREDDIDMEEFHRERQFSRMLRQSKKSRRRLKSGSSFSKSVDDGDESHNPPVSSDADGGQQGERTASSKHWPTSDRHHPNVKSSSDAITGIGRLSDTELSYHSDGCRNKDRRKLLQQQFSEENNKRLLKTIGKSRDSYSEKDFRSCRKSNERFQSSGSLKKDSFTGNDDVPFRIKVGVQSCDGLDTKDTKFNQSQRGNEMDRSVDRESRYSRESRTSRESRYSRESRISLTSTVSHESVEAPPAKMKSQHKRRLHRQQDCYYSSSSSVFSDVLPYDISETSQPKPAKPRKTVAEGERTIAQQLELPRRRDSYTTTQPNNLSPQMALNRHRKKKTRIRRYDCSLSPRRSVSPRRTSDQEEKILLKVADGQRRMTLSHCENIVLPSERRFSECLSSSKPHEILLHRDCSDHSKRTCGLGMRVIGGKTCPNGSLGAFVTMTTKDGPAAIQGISQGDQIVEWNGRSLIDVTFEEAQEIISQSGNLVQVSVIHNPEDQSNTASSKSLQHPIIVRAGTLDTPSTIHPSMLLLNKPKRRMLPKTPVEIKRNVRQISGSICMQLDYDVKCQCLLVVLLRGEDITSTDGDEDPSPLAMLHLLPNRATHLAKETEQKFNTKCPNWNETFVFSDISEEEINSLALEITVWNVKETDDEFLGEVLLDLSEAKLDNTPATYHLEDHDDNSSPLPYRKKSFSLSENSAISPVTSIETSSVYPSLNPSPRSSLSTKAPEGQRTLPVTPAQEKLKELMQGGKHSPGRDRMELSSSAQSSPVYSPTSPGHEFHGAQSFSSIVRRKMIAVARLSSSFMMHGSKREGSSDPGLNRSHSYNDVSNTMALLDTPTHGPRRSFEYNPRRQSLLAPPHLLSRSNSSRELFVDSTDTDTAPNPDRPAPEGDDITSLLGPGQIAPKVSFETEVCGDIKMGFMVSKGQLEIDIVVVKGLTKNRVSTAPDTYVKTYLVEGSKTVQKKKTHTVKMNFDPIFRKTIKYSACNIHGRCIKVNVWEKQKTFDKKQCLGEAIVKLDNLDLSNHTMAWYKLFPAGAADFGSSESLAFWGYH